MNLENHGNLGLVFGFCCWGLHSVQHRLVHNLGLCAYLSVGMCLLCQSPLESVLLRRSQAQVQVLHVFGRSCTPQQECWRCCLASVPHPSRPVTVTYGWRIMAVTHATNTLLWLYHQRVSDFLFPCRMASRRIRRTAASSLWQQRTIPGTWTRLHCPGVAANQLVS